MFNRFVWQSDRMLVDDLVFRIQHVKSDHWDGPEHFMFYKLKGLVDQYESFFTQRPGFKPKNIFELGIFDGGGTAFWREVFHPRKLVAIDLNNKGDSPYFRHYLDSRGLSEIISTHWGIDQSDKSRLREIAVSEFDGPLDLVIDDCSHFYAPTLASFEALFPSLAAGGFYIIEDWAWGHWPTHNGPDHPWVVEEPLTPLVIKFIEAIGTSYRLINSLTVMGGFVAVERSDQSIDHPAGLNIENYIVRRPAGPRMLLASNILMLKRRLSQLVTSTRQWVARALPAGTLQRRIYDRIKMLSKAGRREE